MLSDVDGQAVMLLLAAGVAGAALAVARGLRATRGLRAAVAELRAQAVSAEALRDGARVALRGRLVGPPGTAAVGLRLHGRDVGGGARGSAPGASRRPDLAVELSAHDVGPARRVPLDGPLSVVAGAEVIASRGRDVELIAPLHQDALRVARPAPQTESPASMGSVGVEFTELHRVPVGTPVVAAGRLVRAPASSEVGYRDAAERWILVGSDEDPIQLASERPGPAGWAARRWTPGFLLGLLVGLAALHLLVP